MKNSIREDGDFRFQSLRRAMHHWIKKGDADRAYSRARELFHIAHGILRQVPQDVVVKTYTNPNKDPLTGC